MEQNKISIKDKIISLFMIVIGIILTPIVLLYFVKSFVSPSGDVMDIITISITLLFFSIGLGCLYGGISTFKKK